ncbi:hypothetical protein ISN44_As11g031260 [Arabidopsis suecica]|uniref:Uncharacterized protein n=1 Tax=Arabidopsis suecica TaxID=45249 RepID=A0A8T1ZDI9_ARASU|nr:hypothetical protein ISN44_As11g031260 [Arabidopsis suecica]KAG7557128.1 hypothetical protein ISN44_As11g031260 [Arabidopsis suecica]KAG7557129.1 hypothetical protein ISN44_As11g031260 [Arabidopsis suecica]
MKKKSLFCDPFAHSREEHTTAMTTPITEKLETQVDSPIQNRYSLVTEIRSNNEDATDFEEFLVRICRCISNSRYDKAKLDDKTSLCQAIQRLQFEQNQRVI